MTEERRVTYADLRQGLLDYYSTMKKKSLQTLADGTETIWGLAALDKFFEHTSETPSHTPAVSISDDTAARFIRERRTEGVSDGTIRGSLALLVQMFSRAKSTNKLSNVPKITLPKAPESKNDFIREPELAVLLKALPERLHPILTFLFYQGTRSSEAAGIKWSQIDLNRGLYSPKAAMTKTGEKNVRPLHDKVLSAMRTLGAHEPDELVFDTTNLRKSFMKASVKLGFSKYAWVCGQCGAVDGSNPKRQAVCDNPECSAPPTHWRHAGLTIHGFRRSCVVYYRERGISDAVIRSITGHKTLAVYNDYNVVDVRAAKAAMEVAARPALPA